MNISEIEMSAIPSTLRSYARILRKSFLPGSLSLPSAVLSTSYRGLSVHVKRLERYQEICGFNKEATIPISFPQVMAMPFATHLLSRPEFQIPVLGIIHTQETTHYPTPLRLERTYDLISTLGQITPTDRGKESSLSFSLSHGGKIHWSSTSYFLYPKKGKRRKITRSAEVPLEVSGSELWEIPKGIGWQFSKVNGDLNPIHWNRVTARCFGQTTPIVHGSYLLGRVAAALERHLSSRISAIEIQFKRPVRFPAMLTFVFSKLESRFAILDKEEMRTHVLGSFRVE